MHGLIFHEVRAQKFHLSGLAELCIFPSQTLIELLSLVVPLCVYVCVCVYAPCSAFSLLQWLDCVGILKACWPTWCGLFHCRRAECLALFTNRPPPVPLSCLRPAAHLAWWFLPRVNGVNRMLFLRAEIAELGQWHRTAQGAALPAVLPSHLPPNVYLAGTSCLTIYW